MRLSVPALAVLSASLLAAVSAHVGIDVLGDYLVRDDSYDHLSHGSRILFTIVALAIAAGVGVHLFSRLCNAAISVRDRVRLQRYTLGQIAGVLAAVALLTLIFVPAMETIDALNSGGDLTSLADAFGGSMLLGVLTSIACAFGWSGLIIGLIAWLCRHREHVVKLLYHMLTATNMPSVGYHERRERDALASRTQAVRSQRHSKRGPPLRAHFAAP